MFSCPYLLLSRPRERALLSISLTFSRSDGSSIVRSTRRITTITRANKVDRARFTPRIYSAENPTNTVERDIYDTGKVRERGETITCDVLRRNGKGRIASSREVSFRCCVVSAFCRNAPVSPRRPRTICLIRIAVCIRRSSGFDNRRRRDARASKCTARSRIHHPRARARAQLRCTSCPLRCVFARCIIPHGRIAANPQG